MLCSNRRSSLTSVIPIGIILIISCSTNNNSVQAFFPTHHSRVLKPLLSLSSSSPPIYHIGRNNGALVNIDIDRHHSILPMQYPKSKSLFGTATSTDIDLISSTASPTNNDKEKTSDTSQVIKEQVSFSHIHIYVDHLEDIAIYKQLEQKVTHFAQTSDPYHCSTIDDNNDGSSTSVQRLVMEGANINKCRSIWNEPSDGEYDSESEKPFITQKRDVVKQLIMGLGFRVTGMRYPSSSGGDGTGDDGEAVSTRSLLLTTRDPNGVQFVVSALGEGEEEVEGLTMDHYDHFDAATIKHFYKLHSNRQGIATLGFQVSSGTIEAIHNRYKQRHPRLLTQECLNGVIQYPNSESTDKKGTTKVLEVYAYYQDEKGGDADCGTRLRFIQTDDGEGEGQGGIETDRSCCLLPGFKPVRATYDNTCFPAYFDHWVSNVVNREGFIETLEETLGFTPKVDFNAGVVAAGEAQIESTVTGNNSSFSALQKEFVLRDQSQVYLPINNAVTEVGHVHGFLEEVGQGIQHIASRVDDLAAFVQRGNDFRRITGEGFTFLKIPRSYYGVLTINQLRQCGQGETQSTLSLSCASSIIDACGKSGMITPDAAVDLSLSRSDILDRLRSTIDAESSDEFAANEDDIVDSILKSRYSNLYNLLGDNISTDLYIALIRNQILVDVQGGDILFQIFTSNILQRKVGEEAPFLEFIQRVCSECNDAEGESVAIKAGCGGFGIRNFLTLFLSIEVGKALVEVSDAKSVGDPIMLDLAERKVELFTDQLNESNPILTEIADAMSAEGDALNRVQQAEVKGDRAAAVEFRKRMEEARVSKELSNVKLMSCSAKYNELMKSLRLSRN